jgi:hypothetical protein
MTHLLYIAYYILLILHATNFWKWFVIPLVFLIIEKISTLFRICSVKYGETYIKDVNLLSSKVISDLLNSKIIN